ncbi:glycosyltransferase family 4 protein [Micromonospora sp. CPCC 206061]|uniref:glycosyltransferase family 4 protein n=1 Tax=Micromonospora sp. CPCC 206061 TaxID=3122410 RepID=UPI002FF0F24B
MIATYVALGPHRLPAAVHHTARLAADGAEVHLIVADRPDTADLEVAPGVTVHRVDAATPQSAIVAATRLAAGRKHALPTANLMIAGDLQALPVAWAAHRRHRELTVRFEPGTDPGRRPAAADLAVVTPWYPSPNDPFSGSFVQAAARAVDGTFERVAILHTQEWGFPKDTPGAADRLGLIADRLAARWGNATLEDRPEGELTRVCVPVVTSGVNYARRVDSHVRMLGAALPTGRIEAPLIHAHTGIYGGVLAAELGRPDARIVVTEHASFLPKVFGDRASRQRYERMLARVDVLMCVSRHLLDLVSAQFPQHREKLRIVPNVVDFDHFAVRPEPPSDLLRWLYVGRMLAQKGVPLLIDAFARVAREQSRATLTLVGSGELDESIQRRIGEPDLRGRVELRPPVPPAQVGELMRHHDVLVHASPAETFGLTVVEAVATGTPVLVARSQGPAETLAGLDGVAGLMFEPGDDPAAIVDGYRDLRERLSTLDLAKARESLVGRYGRETVRADLLDAYRPDLAGQESRAGDRQGARVTAGRLVLIAMNPSSPGAIRDFTRAVTGRGYAVDVLTADGALESRVAGGERVRVFSVEAAERRLLVLRAERFLVYKAPGKLLATAAALARRQPAIGPELAVLRLRRGYRRAAGYFHARVFRRGYNVVRPFILWRIARREVLPQLELAGASRVVISGASGVAIGWRLARRHPDLTVTTSMSVPAGE